MDGVVVETADSGCAATGCLGLEVQDLTDQSCFPVQSTIQPRADLTQAGFELGDHAAAKRTGSGDLLVAAHPPRDRPNVALSEQKQR